MKLPLLVIFLLVCRLAIGQCDTTRQNIPNGRFVAAMSRMSKTKAYQMTYVGVPLVLAGVIVQGRDSEFRNLRNNYAHSFRYRYDDYLQYGPAALMLSLKAAGVKGRSSWGRMLVSDAFSIGVTLMLVNSIKYTAKVQRPDRSVRNSFPSGHTATAFMTATMLHKEYGDRSAWYSIGGYTLASTIGVSRMLNNRHWLSDVLAGAGIGILSTEVGYLLADLIFKDRGINTFERNSLFSRCDRPSFVGIGMGIDIYAGIYHPADGVAMNFSPGVSTTIEGAWFVTPNFGVGASFSASSMPVKINRMALFDRLNSAGTMLRGYYSYPLLPRWLIGASLGAGYHYYPKFAPEEFAQQNLCLGDRGGFTWGGGTSTTFRVNDGLDLRFVCNYSMMPSFSQFSTQNVHRVNLAANMCIAF